MGFIKSLHCWICRIGKVLQPFVLLGLRVLFGFGFFQAGLGKLQGIENTVSSFESIGIMWPTFNAYLVGGVECVGGLMLIFGFAARFAAVPLTIAMLTAYFTAHFDAVQGFVDNPLGLVTESPFGFLVTSLLVWAFGPGMISIDAIISRFCCRTK